MNKRQKALTEKNVIQWDARVKKLEAKDALTAGETEELAHRRAQVTVWAIDLNREGIEAPANPGDMSAGDSIGSSESASAT